MTQDIKTSDLTIMGSGIMCYQWYNTYTQAQNSFTTFFYQLTGNILTDVSYLFKRKIKYYIERSEDGNEYRACIKEIF